jgi:hypothetical protein
MERTILGGIANLLQVRQPEQFDVVLAETTIGNRSANWGKGQRFAGVIELQVKISVIVKVWPGDQVEPVPLPRTRKCSEEDLKVPGRSWV